jgi:molecular chaperone DnaJ
MPRDFYVVLGVSRDADEGAIKAAYRQLVKLYHPDAAPEAPVDRFLEVQQAYECLCDPEARARNEQREPAAPSDGEPRVVASAPAREVSRARDLAVERSSELDDFFAGWVPGLFGASTEARLEKDLYAELVLSPAEARAGGMLPLQIPVEQGCPECAGAGLSGPLACGVCRGRGRVVDFHAIEVSVPPGVEDGTLARIPLADIGLPRVTLKLLVTLDTR